VILEWIRRGSTALIRRWRSTSNTSPSAPPLPEMPLFLHSDRYINVPLEPTYEAAYGGMPAFWRDVLERGPA
jgi:hypothetical protein